MASLRHRLDPRRHLSASIGWSVFLIVVLAATVGATLSAERTELQVRKDNERLLGQFATRAMHGLHQGLATRQSILQASAAQIVASSDRGSDALTAHLAALQQEFPEFGWLAVADSGGHVVARVGDVPQEPEPSQQPWFLRRHDGPYLRAAAAAPGGVPAAEGAHQNPDAAPTQIEISVPLKQAEGRIVGVLGGALSWRWLRDMASELAQGLDPSRHLHLWLLADDGTIVIRPGFRRGEGPHSILDLSDGGRMLVGRYGVRSSEHGSPGWTVVVAEDKQDAMARGRSTLEIVFLSTLLSGLAAGALAAWITHVLLARLRRLALQALEVQGGTRDALDSSPGIDEVAQIGATLASTVTQLNREKRSLMRLNAELDQRVAARTNRIERLADEARQAAVVRERLRLARDLHDTLAHSLMALIAQLRLVRKLHRQMPGAELEEELGCAEVVAMNGLQEARAAIMQMRHNSVRETGLVAALEELLKRFAERTGIVARLQQDGLAAHISGERAETAFRLVEEALRNVERHSNARTVEVRLSSKLPNEETPDTGMAPRVLLEVVDDGIGFDPAAPAPGHYGLPGMAEQAALMQAKLQVLSTHGRGTRIAVELDA